MGNYIPPWKRAQEMKRKGKDDEQDAVDEDADEKSDDADEKSDDADEKSDDADDADDKDVPATNPFSWKTQPNKYAKWAREHPGQIKQDGRPKKTFSQMKEPGDKPNTDIGSELFGNDVLDEATITLTVGKLKSIISDAMGDQ